MKLLDILNRESRKDKQKRMRITGSQFAAENFMYELNNHPKVRLGEGINVKKHSGDIVIGRDARERQIKRIAEYLEIFHSLKDPLKEQFIVGFDEGLKDIQSQYKGHFNFQTPQHQRILDEVNEEVQGKRTELIKTLKKPRK